MEFPDSPGIVSGEIQKRAVTKQLSEIDIKRANSKFGFRSYGDYRQLLTGMWYGVEIISQKENDERYGLRQINSCPIIYISEKNSPTNPNPRNENNTDSYGTVYGKSEYQRYAEDIKRLTLLWDENGSYVEYSLRYNTSKPGLWISSGSNNGSSLEEQYNKFDGMVQVIKAVGNHLTLTFCRQLPDQQLYTALLSRVPTLAQHEISDVHDLLAKRGLETYNSIKMKETEKQEKIHILQEEETEEQAEIEKRIDNCKEDKMMHILIEMMQQNSAFVSNMEENNQKLEETYQKLEEKNSALENKLEENNQKLEKKNSAIVNKLEETMLNKLEETVKNWTKQELKLKQK
ncbi:hypothetical protein FQA39_LY08350 [Lamprigera yunnana]|nr:hypothetical protein FQA39_LY08350 [Lamprigera yunnana]